MIRKGTAVFMNSLGYNVSKSGWALWSAAFTDHSSVNDRLWPEAAIQYQ